MRIFEMSPKAGIAALLLLAFAGSGPALAQQGPAPAGPTFKSADIAFDQGLNAYRGGYYEHAIPAFRFAAERDSLLAQYYLARIYADSSTPYTHHGAAYRLYERIAKEHANIDPDDDQRALVVAKAMTAYALYLKDGLAEIGLKADAAAAVPYLRQAAWFFRLDDAQFEFAKLQLKGEGLQQNVSAGLHSLVVLSQRGHAGGQALLADIYWRGLYNIKKDPARAFALIKLAVENAPDSERIWIEDVYQRIFCGSSIGARQQGDGMVADWRQKIVRPAQNLERSPLGPLPPRADRTCGNGETVAPVLRQPTHAGETPRMMQGGVLGIGVRRPEAER